MSKKICECGGINDSSTMYCSSCGKSLVGATITNDNNERYSFNNSDSISYQNTDEIVSIGSWIGIMILLCIPIVNIITIFVLAFGNGNESLKNFGKASLIISGISLVLLILISAVN